MDVTAEQKLRRSRVGVWLPPGMLLATPIAVQRREFTRIEQLGYGSLWSGEPPEGSPAAGREVLVQHALMLAGTERLVIGTGIANIGRRDAPALHTGAATLAEAYPGRFVLGLGGRRHDNRPLAQLSDYLDAMDVAGELVPDVRYPRVLAALGPLAHKLAAERADGAHPFLQPVEQTALSRAALGPDKLLIPHQAVVLETDAERARGVMRGLLAAGPPDVATPYARNYRRLGYTDDDLRGDRSDRMVDATLAWGDEPAVAGRVRAQLDAGADHVLVHPMARDLPSTVDQLERLGPALFAGR